MVNFDPIQGLPDSEEYDVRQEELSAEDVARRQRKLRPKEGSYVMDPHKFSPKPKMARLYRADGSIAPVPLATYDRYLRKRDINGNRIFYVNPPTEAPKATSDPCPVNIGGKICGMRLLDQFELMRHIMLKHRDRAGFYLTEEQVQMAMGKVRYSGNPGISMEPKSAPAVVEVPGLVDVRVAEPITEPVTDFRDREMEGVEEVQFVEDEPTAQVADIPHTCEYLGRFGRYDPTCLKCADMQATRVARGFKPV